MLNVKWIRVVFSGILLFTCVYSFSQNLIPNPGFEDYSRCQTHITNMYDPIKTLQWYSPSNGTPDLFSSCATLSDVATPSNFAGYAIPVEGNSYTGLFYGNKEETIDKNYREYLSVKLISSLVKDSSYICRFYTKIASNCRYSNNVITFSLSNDSIYLNDDVVITGVNYFTINLDTLEGVNGWKKIEMVIQAAGGERYLTIGNFRLPGPEEYRLRYSGSSRNMHVGGSAYYYFDNFSLLPHYPVEKYKLNEFFSFQNVYFDFDSYKLDSLLYHNLDDLVSYLSQNKKALQIRGHADKAGSSKYNDKLSLKRALDIKKYLVNHGIKESRIEVLSYGEKNPASILDFMNRRVEFKIID